MALKMTAQAVVESLPRLPAFPQIVLNILAVLDDENSSISVLINHLQRDPVIAGRVLAAANNSSQYGQRNMGGIATAVSFIGMRRVREIVLTTSLVDFSRQTRSSQFFLEHCLAVGIATQELAKEVSLNPDRALIAGLLHDIGKLWMCYLYPKQHQEVITHLDRHHNPLCDVEQEIFGMDHCKIGAVIAQHWGLPEDIIEAISLHHQINVPDMNPLAAITHIAEAISNGLDFPYREDNQIVDISAQALQLIGLDWSVDQSDLFGRIDGRFQYARSLLASP